MKMILSHGVEGREGMIEIPMKHEIYISILLLETFKEIEYSCQV